MIVELEPGHPIPAERTAVAVDELADHVARLRLINSKIKALQAQGEEIKAAIQDLMGDHEVGTVHGRPAVTWTHHTRHAFDQTAFRAAEPDVYRAYLKTSAVRPFTLTEERAHEAD